MFHVNSTPPCSFFDRIIGIDSSYFGCCNTVTGWFPLFIPFIIIGFGEGAKGLNNKVPILKTSKQNKLKIKKQL